MLIIPLNSYSLVSHPSQCSFGPVSWSGEGPKRQSVFWTQRRPCGQGNLHKACRYSAGNNREDFIFIYLIGSFNLSSHLVCKSSNCPAVWSHGSVPWAKPHPSAWVQGRNSPLRTLRPSELPLGVTDSGQSEPWICGRCPTVHPDRKRNI